MNLKTEIRNGVLITSLGKYSNVVIQLIVTAILSRLLSPSEYGIVAIVNVFLIFASLLIDMGIGPALIQNKTLSRSQENEIYTFTLLISAIATIFFASMSKAISVFYHNNDLFYACLSMSVVLLISGMNIVPQALLAKKKMFAYINAIQIISSLANGIVGISLAFLNFSYFSLIIGVIIKNVITFLGYKNKTDVRIVYRVHKKSLSKVYYFSKYQFLFSFINYFSRNLDNILIGKVMSAQTLAYYDKAYSLTLYPSQYLTNIITPVIQPVMSNFVKRMDIILNTYLNIVRILSLIGFPLTVFTFFSSKEIIYILYGPQWGVSVDILKILSLSIGVQMILSSTGSIFQSTNRPDLLFLSGILSAVLNVTSIIVGILINNVNILALGLSVSFMVNFVQAHYLLMRYVFKKNQLLFYRVIIRPLILSLIMAIILFFISKLRLSFVVIFILKFIASFILFCLFVIVTGEYKSLVKIFR